MPSKRSPIGATKKQVATKSFAKEDCWVIIPAYNEEKHIEGVVRKTRAQGFSNIVVANDGSKDNTAKIGERAGATIVSHITNLGKGAVMKTGADYAIAHGARAIIFMDGDGQHNPEELPLFVRAFNSGAKVVFGYRHETRNMPFVRKLGKIMTRSVVKMFYNLDLNDILCGYRGVTADSYPLLRWDSRDYRVESEIIARAGRNNLRYAQFEIDTIYHDSYKGMTIFDGISILWYLVTWRMLH